MKNAKDFLIAAIVTAILATVIFLPAVLYMELDIVGFYVIVWIVSAARGFWFMIEQDRERARQW